MANEVPVPVVRPVLLGGGIGAGKSSVAAVFADQGFSVVIADDVGRDVLGPGAPALDQVAQRWPDVVTDGVVDRRGLAAIVFASPEELRALEAITHPVIRQRIRERLDADPRPAVVEVPVMGVLGELDATRVAVVAPDDVRLARAVARGNERDDVEARMASQPAQEEWCAWADVVIDNGGPWSATVRLVEALIADLGVGVAP